MLLIPLSVLLSLSTPTSAADCVCFPGCCASTQPPKAEVVATQGPTSAPAAAPTANVGPAAATPSVSGCCAPGCCAS